MAVRVWAETFYAWNRDNNGYRSAENLELLNRAAKQARASHLPAREIADVLYNLGSDLELRGELPQADVIFRQAIAAYLGHGGRSEQVSEAKGRARSGHAPV